MGISDLVRFTPIWSDLVIRVTRAPPRALRSSDAPMLVVPRIHTKLARRAFSIAAPSTFDMQRHRKTFYLLTYLPADIHSLTHSLLRLTS